MNRSFIKRARIALALSFLIVGTAISNRAAVPVEPRVGNVTEAERFMLAQMDAQHSLNKKIEVGQERYQQKQLHRSRMIEGMAAELAERKQAVSIPSAKPQNLTSKPSTGLSLLVWAAALLGTSLIVFHHFHSRDRSPESGLGSKLVFTSSSSFNPKRRGAEMGQS